MRKVFFVIPTKPTNLCDIERFDIMRINPGTQLLKVGMNKEVKFNSLNFVVVWK